MAGASVPVLPGGQVVLPVPSPSCRGFGGSGPDLNPIDHLPVIGDASHLVSALGGMVSTVLGWLGNPGQAAHDIVGWFTWNTIGWNPDAPNCYDPTSTYGFARSILVGDVQLDGSSLYHDAYSSLALVSMVIVFAAAVGRVVRLSHDQRSHWGTGLGDTVLRAIAGVAAVQLGFAVLGWLISLSAELAVAVFGAVASIAVPQASVTDPLGALLFTSLAHLGRLGLLAILLIPVLLFQLVRVVVLMLMRYVVICFGVATAPLFIALAVFDHNTQAVQWWWRMMLGAMVAPVVAAAMVGLTIGLAVRTQMTGSSLTSIELGPVVAVIITIGGLWLTGRALRALLSGLGGQHGSLMATVRHAAEALLLVPAAVASLAAGGALLAAGGAGAGAVLRGLGSGRYGSGLVGSAMASNNPLSRAAGLRFYSSPSQAFSAFRASPQGSSFIGELTSGLMPTSATPGARWAAVESLPGMDSAMRRLRMDVHAQSARTGELGVSPSAWATFDQAVSSAWPMRTGAPPDDAADQSQQPPPRSPMPPPDIRS